jgi:thioredoxin 1
MEFYKVDVDNEEEISQEVGIKAMPTFVAFKDGEKMDEVVGANPGAIHNMVATFKSLVDPV